MKQISKEEFLKLSKPANKYDKYWTITSVKKPGKRKKYYIPDYIFNKYVKKKG